MRKELLHILSKQQLMTCSGLVERPEPLKPSKASVRSATGAGLAEIDVRLIAILCQPEPSYFCVLLPASAVFRWTSFVTLHCRSVGDVSGPGAEVAAAHSVLPRPPYTSG